MINLLLFTSLFISFITDVKNRKILNIVTFPAILAGLCLHFFNSGFDGLMHSGLGLLLGAALLFVPFALGGMGAGDVKLLAAIGALKGSAFVWTTFLYMGLIGGLIALLILLKKRQLTFFFQKLWFFGLKKEYFPAPSELNNQNSFPYGIAIIFGAFCAFI